MGDAGPPTPIEEVLEGAATIQQEQEHIREIHILVTGFGAFKSFPINPSWLIASGLPTELGPIPLSEPSIASAQLQPQATPVHRNPLASLLRRASASTSTNQAQAGQQEAPQPLRPANSTPYRIHIHTYPHAVRVAYDPTSVLIPSLLNPLTNHSAFPHHPPGHPGIDFDFVLHIGLASGRDSYTLETIAHQDEYVIPDVDEQKGYLAGEKIWKSLNVPTRLEVGWHPADVLRRWIAEVERRQDDEDKTQAQLAQAPTQAQIQIQTQTQPRTLDENQAQRTTNTGGVRHFISSHGMLGLRGGGAMVTNTETPPPQQLSSASTSNKSVPKPRRAVVKLSRDAGRYLCEFILMCSLVYRYLESKKQDHHHQHHYSPIQDNYYHANEKLGKIAFLHVPNGIEPPDVARGVMVAESAIRSLVASWEAGWRNPSVYSPITIAATSSSVSSVPSESVEVVQGDVDAFEKRGTGDA